MIQKFEIFVYKSYEILYNTEFKYDRVLFTYEFHLYEILVVINNII